MASCHFGAGRSNVRRMKWGSEMRVRLVSSAAVLALGALALGAPARGQSSPPARRIQVAQIYPAIPKPSDRKTGELEGWTDDKKPANAATPGKKDKGRTVAVKAKDKPAAQKPKARDPEDGGLPLPNTGVKEEGLPVGFDKDGKVGTGFKF